MLQGFPESLHYESALRVSLLVCAKSYWPGTPSLYDLWLVITSCLIQTAIHYHWQIPLRNMKNDRFSGYRHFIKCQESIIPAR